MNLQKYLNYISELIARDDLKNAIVHLQKLLRGSRKLDEVIIQSARFNDLMKQIRDGTLDFEKVDIAKNKIRLAILMLLEEINETTLTNEAVAGELEHSGPWFVEGQTVIHGSGNVVIKDVHSGRDSNIVVRKNSDHDEERN